MVTELTIIKMDDLHVHVRDGDMLKGVMPYTARNCGRAIIMPNLDPAVKTVEEAKRYRERVLAAAHRFAFEPLMTLYLTEETSLATIREAKECGFVHAFKYYPRGATTNSAEGVRDLRLVAEQLEEMEKVGMRLLLHGETNLDESGKAIDPFDKERYFMDKDLAWLMRTFPTLKKVLEHISTKESVERIDESCGAYLAATITPHHPFEDRRALFDGGLNPDHFCLPVLKREEDMLALRRLMTSGNPYVFAGTDSAPHPRTKKEKACGCAGGCFVAPVAIPMYAQLFEEANALDKLEAFLSRNGADWYGLPYNQQKLTLTRNDEPTRSEEFVAAAGTGIWNPDGSVRVFGVHDDPKKSLKFHWRVEKALVQA